MSLLARARALSARTPLRIRLVAAVLALVTVALSATGVVAAASLRGYLYDRVDTQLTDLSHLEIGRLHRGVGVALQRLAVRRGTLPTEFYVAVTGADGHILSDTSAQLSAGQSPPRLSPAQVLDSTDQPFTAPARRGQAGWRVLVTDLPDSAREVVLAESLADVDATVGQLVDIEVPVGVLTLLVLAGLGYTAVRRSLRPLRAMEGTAGAIAAGDLSRRVAPLDPRTEVGRLAASFNAMVARIEEAFVARERSAAAAQESEERMRRFVADASHELRTPLTSIRGYAELYRQGAAGDPAEVRRLLARIEAEATRMGTLVEDLLLLARLDEQRPLAADPVDLLQLATEAVHGASAVDPTRRIRVHLDPQATAPPVVTGDAGRLRQVLDNLLTNAWQHTPPGTPVTVRLGTTADPPRAVVEVIDAGPGLAPEQAERVFERFYRTDASRTRRSGGTGLGLAIVDALVAAHHGEVTVRTAPGEGCTFRVVLPLAFADSPAPPRPPRTPAPARG